MADGPADGKRPSADFAASLALKRRRVAAEEPLPALAPPPVKLTALPPSKPAPSRATRTAGPRPLPPAVPLAGCGPCAPGLRGGVFPRQADAFAALDAQLAAVTARPPPLGPFAYSTELSGGGKRCFVVSHLSAFWAAYARMHPSERHEYELLRVDTPVHVFFDIEYRRGLQEIEAASGAGRGVRELNTGADGEGAVSDLLARLAAALHATYGLLIDRSHIVHLESSSATKFSRHLTVRLPGGARFRDVSHCGRFVSRLHAELREEAGQGPRGEREEAALHATWLPRLWLESTRAERAEASPASAAVAGCGHDWVPTEGELAAIEAASVPRPQALRREFLVDLGVYTRNRALRMAFSCKAGKTAPLLPAASHAFNLEAFRAEAAGGFLARGSSGAAGAGSTSGECAAPPHCPLPVSYWLRSSQAVVPPHTEPRVPPAVQVGDAGWERDSWRASLISDGMPPLWMSRALAEGAGAPSAAVFEAEAASYVPATHPIHGFRLLYCWPEGEGAARDGRMAGGSAAAPSAALPRGGEGRTWRVEGGPASAADPSISRILEWVCAIGSGPIPPDAWLHGPAAATAVQQGAASQPRRAAVRSWRATYRGGEGGGAGGGGGGALLGLSVSLSGSRYCHYVGRHHASNGVWWELDVERGYATQSCFDQDCRGFSSPAVAFPAGLLGGEGSHTKS